jgi:hypothetical protein
MISIGVIAAFGQLIAMIGNAIGGNVAIGGARTIPGVPDMGIIIFISNLGIRQCVLHVRRRLARPERATIVPRYSDHCRIRTEGMTIDLTGMMAMGAGRKEGPIDGTGVPMIMVMVSQTVGRKRAPDRRL